MPDRSPDPRHWRARIRVTASLLLAWFAVTFGATYFARSLGGTFSFWMAAQGAVICYALLVWFYAWRMARIDDEFGVAEDD